MIQRRFFLKPSIELVFASLLWGLTFVLTSWVLLELDPGVLLVARFAIAGGVGLGISILVSEFDSIFWPGKSEARQATKLLKSESSTKILWQDHKQEARWAFVPAFFLALTLILQTWGLKNSTPTKSGFITTLYVLIVPLIGPLVGPLFKSQHLNERISLKHGIAVAIALGGTLLLVNFKSESLIWADALLLGNAFASAFHILVLGRISLISRHPFLLNAYQSLWSAIMLIPMMAFDSRRDLFALSFKAWASLLGTSLGASLIAFYLQLKAQARISPSVAALLFLMEAPFAMMFSVLLMNESFSSLQLLGAILILGACSSSIFFSRRK